MIRYSEDKEIDKSQLEALFLSVGWESGNVPDRLQRAIRGYDTVITAWEDGTLVGLIAAMDDGEMTAYVHYLLVHSDVQSHGIGGELLERLKDGYAGYLKIALIGEHPAAKFYAAHGFVTEEKASPMYFFPDQKDR